MNHKKRSTRASMRRLSVLLGLLLLAMAAFTGWYLRRPTQKPAASADTVPLLEENLDAYLSPETEANLEEDAVQDVLSPADPIGGSGSRIVNILLVGQDRLEGEGRTRSDSMILCTFNKRTRELTLTSFLRDLYVQIPGYGGNRINAAYAYGGMELLEQTLEQNFGVQVDGIVEVDFSG